MASLAPTARVGSAIACPSFFCCHRQAQRVERRVEGPVGMGCTGAATQRDIMALPPVPATRALPAPSPPAIPNPPPRPRPLAPQIPHLDGTTIDFPVKDLVRPGDTKVVR